jgi:hypothetical protein
MKVLRLALAQQLQMGLLPQLQEESSFLGEIP